MKTNEKGETQPYEVAGPVSHADIRRTRQLFLKADKNAGGNYEAALRDERIVTYNLIDSTTGSPIGFVAMKMQLEDLGPEWPANAYFAVHYVFLMPQYRGLGLGRLLRYKVEETALTWLAEQRRTVNTDLRCMSSSEAISAEGLRFLRRLDTTLLSWCREHRVQHVTSIAAT